MAAADRRARGVLRRRRPDDGRGAAAQDDRGPEYLAGPVLPLRLADQRLHPGLRDRDAAHGPRLRRVWARAHLRAGAGRIYAGLRLGGAIAGPHDGGDRAQRAGPRRRRYRAGVDGDRLGCVSARTPRPWHRRNGGGDGSRRADRAAMGRRSGRADRLARRLLDQSADVHTARDRCLVAHTRPAGARARLDRRGGRRAVRRQPGLPDDRR